ncbi:unnamed protein product [Adineta steineri]|uniref:Uncharacterized protein n=1 Tax=Adineta steineri TaxID=433720 RepID=A0A814CXG9_9BILA|nr:unnamed protein product [Adineta steineri]CAF0946679.1 unnamed protein product [Adineta steineri]
MSEIVKKIKKPLERNKENNVTDPIHKTNQQLQEQLNNQTSTIQQLNADLTNINKLVHELQELVLKQSAKITLLESQLEYEKKNLSGSDISDKSPDKHL